MELQDVSRRRSQDSHMSMENALLNVATSHISASMNKLNEVKVGIQQQCLTLNELFAS